MNIEACLRGYLAKRGGEMSAAARKRVKTGNFGIPSKARTKAEKAESGNYPIHDRKHARAALAYGSRYLDPKKLAALRRGIKARYPSMVVDD